MKNLISQNCVAGTGNSGDVVEGNDVCENFVKLQMVLCQDLKQIKMRIFHQKINICSLSCIYTII